MKFASSQIANGNKEFIDELEINDFSLTITSPLLFGGMPKSFPLEQITIAIKNSHSGFADVIVYFQGAGMTVHNLTLTEANSIKNIVELGSAKEQVKIKKAEEKFHSLLDAIPDASFIVIEDGTINQINKEAVTLFGYTPEELTGKPIEILVPPEFRKNHYHSRNSFMSAKANRAMDTGIELSAIRKDGSIFPADISLKIIESEEGRQVLASVRDISQRKTNQEQLESLSHQINQTNDAIYFVDNNGNIKSWNKGAEKLYGFSEKEVLGKNSIEILTTATSAEELTAAINKIAKEGYWTGELKRKSKSGKDIYVRSSLTSIKNHTGEITGYVSVSFDITCQKKLREQVNHLANLVEQSSEAIISRGPDKRLISWNKGAENLMGYSKKEAIGKTAKELGMIRFSEEEIAELEKEVRETGSWKAEKIYYHKNGNSFYGAVTANAIKNEEGDITSLVFIIKDISHRKRLEVQLLTENELLEEKVKSRTEEIKRSEKQYRNLFENNPMPMWVFDLSTFKFLDVNEMAVLQYGYSREEFLSMTVLDIRPAEERELFLKIDHSFESSPKDYNKGIWNHLKKDGTIIQVEIIAHQIMFEGAEARLILANDITEKKKAEEKLMASEMRFRALIENSAEGVSLLDEFSNVIYRSSAGYKVIGDSPLKNSISYAHPDDLEYFKDKFNESLSNHGIPVPYKVRFLHSAGNYFWAEGTFTNLLNLKGVNAVVANYRDVSFRVEAEEKLVQREKRFRALIENISDAIVMNDEHSNILYQSPSVARILGYSDNERIGKKVLDYVHPENRNEFLQLYQNLYESPNLPLPFEYRFLHKNGNYIWLEGVVTNMLHNPAVKAFVANYRDITQRKESEEKLIASEKQFRYTLDHMLEGVQIIGFDWRYKYVNDAMAKHGRYLKEAFIGHTVMEMYPGIEHTKIYRIYQQCFNERIPIHLENEFEFPDKHIGWFELSFQPVPEGIFILSVDITERKKAEAQHDLFSFIVNSSDDAIISKSVNGTITSWNNGAASLFGYSEKEAIGKNITMLLPPELLYEEQQIMEKIDKGEYVRHYETERIKKDGTRMNISLTVSPVRNKFGEIVGASKIARDITEQKNAERQKEFDQNNLNALINNTKDLMWSVDRNYRLITSNQAFDKLVALFSGSSPVKGSEIIQGRFTNDDFQKYKGYYDRAFSGETFTEIEHYVTPFEFWSEISFYPIYDGNQVIGTACFSRNITDHKNAAEKLRLSNERYEAVSKATSDAIWDYDYLTGKTFIAGTGYKYLFGYPVINDYCEPLFWESRLHPEDKKRVLAELDEILADKEIRQSALEYRFLKANGSYAYVNDRFFIFRKDGKPVRILGAKQDITIRKTAEDTLTNNLNEKKVLAERLTTILNTLPANIALLNEKGVILDVNEIWKKFADNNGYTGNNYNIGDNYLEISNKSFGEEKSDGQKVASGIKDVLTNKKKEFVYEYPCHSSKVKRWFRMVVTPLKGKDYLGAIVMHIDISEIRSLEQERLKLKMEEQKKITDAMLKGQEKERNAIGIELHDNVNQILAGTNMLLSLINLQPEKSTSLIPSCIDNITQAIQENRKISHELVTPDLSTESLLDQILRLSQTMLQSAGIKVIIDNTDFTESLLNNEQKLTVYRLSQEQCTNIIKYSGAKRVNFTLTTKDKQFIMQITDDGKGANIEKSKNGIGLKNINSRLSILNGTLYIDTKPGNGFTLSVQIPLDENEKK